MFPGAGLFPDATCRFNREEGTGSRRDFFVGSSNVLAASGACCVTDRWFTPHFSVLASMLRFRWTNVLLQLGRRQVELPNDGVWRPLLVLLRLKRSLLDFHGQRGIAVGMLSAQLGTCTSSLKSHSGGFSKSVCFFPPAAAFAWFEAAVLF